MMDEVEKTSTQITKRLRLIARISSVVIIAFTIIMVIGHLFGSEPFEVDYDHRQDILPVLMSLSVFALAIDWRWEGVGGALSLMLFVLVIILDSIIRGGFFPLRGLLALLPLPATALLFLYCWFRTRSR